MNYNSAIFQMRVVFLPVMLSAAVAACAPSGGFPENSGLIPENWRLASTWSCQPDAWRKVIYDGKDTETDSSTGRVGIKKFINMPLGTVTYKFGGDVNPDEIITERIIYSQMQAGIKINTYQSKLTVVSAEHSIGVTVYDIDFESGYYTEYSAGVPLVAVWYGKCNPVQQSSSLSNGN